MPVDDKLAAYQYLRHLQDRWSRICNDPAWLETAIMIERGTWTFERMVQEIKGNLVKGSSQAEDQPYFNFLGDLRDSIMNCPPDSPRGIEYAALCEDLASAPIHQVTNLFATVVLEVVLRDAPAWRRYFFREWVAHSNSQIRSVLAFATCFTDFEQKRHVLLQLSLDPDEFVRGCVVQSLWYENEPYPEPQRDAVKTIIVAATANGGELASKLAADIRKRNVSWMAEK